MAKKKNNKSSGNNNNNNNTNSTVPLVTAVVATTNVTPITTGSSTNDTDTLNSNKTSKATVGDSSNTYYNDDTTIDDGEDDDEEVEEEEEEEEVYELLQVDLGDMIKVKQVLDECVAMILLDYLPENTNWDNMKLCIMSIACIAAMIAQVYTTNITERNSRILLLFCGTTYFVCSTLLQFITTFIDQDTIIWTQPITEKTEEQRLKHRNHILSLKGMNTTGTTMNHYMYYNRKTKTFNNAEPCLPLQNKLFYQYGTRIRTNLPRFSEFYTITLQFHIPKNDTNIKDITTTKSYSVSETYSIGQFFDKNGYFDEIGFANVVEQLLIEQFDQEKYTSITTKTKKEKVN